MVILVKDINGRSVVEAFEGFVLGGYRADFTESELNAFVEDTLGKFFDDDIIMVYPKVWRAVMTFVYLVGRGFGAEVASADVNTHFPQRFTFLKTWGGKLFWDKYANHSIDVFAEGRQSLWSTYKSGYMKKFLDDMKEVIRVAEDKVVELKDLKSVGALKRYCELYDLVSDRKLSGILDCLLSSYDDGHAFTESDVLFMVRVLRNFMFMTVNEED